MAWLESGAGLLVIGALWVVIARARRETARVLVRPLDVDAGDAALVARARQAGVVSLARVAGDLSCSAVAPLDAILADRPPWPDYLLLDLRAVNHADGSALHALTHLYDCLEARAGVVVLVARPASELLGVLQARGLTARALGGTACFTLVHALERVARHGVAAGQDIPVRERVAAAANCQKPVVRHLRLVRAPLDPAS